MPNEATLPPTPCLDRPVPSSQKGGTLICAEIGTLAQQDAVLAEADLVRLPDCRRCGYERLHVHQRRERVLRGHGGRSVVMILVFRCGNRACGATWRVLPRFLARHLWRAWWTVWSVLGLGKPPGTVGVQKVPGSTRRRWRARLRERATVLISVLGSSGRPALALLAQRLGPAATRGDVVSRTGQLDDTALLIHKLMPGVRLM